MERLVDFDKSDFIDKAALEKIRDVGPKRKLHGVFMSGEPFERNNEHRWPVINEAGKVGHVSAAVY